ncbi:uncharacterized protein LOC105683989 isoform X1 [Athalia rosae]|uniref:uncharacterized protein LOC105683989 isoform X1 n=1 Tax=Athalia rosae TaxID=37344 RepID=UPI0020338A8B|nr:uncharacterized protein LOC105683989 isoform X1 [Athalia rosae]
MPDNGAVYQPTTVGYSYDTGVGGFLGIASISRHKFNVRKWLEWAIASVGLALCAAGLLMSVTYLASGSQSINDPESVVAAGNCANGTTTTTTTSTSTTTNEEEEESHPTLVRKGQDGRDRSGVGTIAVAASLTIIGLCLAFIWSWLRFFRKTESLRNEPSGGGGQMLGGLNPSTDLLVGSPSQYGPVLTEVPSHPKPKLQGVNLHQESAASALSDQEEETRTLMQEPAIFNTDRNNVNENQHPA